MKERIVRVYTDTSVFGGILDAEFMRPSRMFFDAVGVGRIHLVVSEVVRMEIEAGPAPAAVRALFNAMLAHAEIAPVTREALDLRDAYLEEKILPPKWSDDALHVALATVSGCQMIVSWNFKHIVHFAKIPLYNAINTLRGFGPVSIHSPLEVIGYGKEG